MRVIMPETSPEGTAITPETSPDFTPETSPDFTETNHDFTTETSHDLSEELINKINCLQLNDLNDQATLSEENGVEAQVNERGHDRNQARERQDCPYARSSSVRSSNLEILSSPPITNEPKSRELLFLSGGGRIEIPSFPPIRSFTYVPQISNVQIDETPKANIEEEDVYHKIREKICENEEINPIPFDELSNLPDEVVELILDNENKVENVPAISPNSCVPETCNSVTQFGTTGIMFVQMCNHPMIQNRKLPAISPKGDPLSHVPNNQIPLPCKKESQDDKYHKRFLKYHRDFGVGKRDQLNRTVLHVLITKKDHKFAIYLVKKINNCFQRKQITNLEGIQSCASFVNSCDNTGQTPLYYAALYNQPKIAECLLNFGADPNMAETQDGNSPLHAASERGKRYLDVVKLICQCHNVDMNICSKKGKSALHVAVQSHGILHEDGSKEICEEIDSGPVLEHLLRHKANLTIQDKDGKTPLHLAVESCKPGLIKILEANANDWKEAVNMVDKNGSTALHIAALLETKEMQSSIIMDLLSRNAKPTIRDSLGRLPAELVSPERNDIADLLKREWSQECMQFIHI